MTHKEVQNLIIKNINSLSKCLGYDNLICQGKELRISDLAILDIVCWKNFESIYRTPEHLIIELKPEKAKHDVLGQILKYKQEMKFHPFNHRDVDYVCIAEDFDDYLIFEFNENNIIPVKYSVINNQIIFNVFRLNFFH